MRKSLITAVVAASLFTLAACSNDDDTDQMIPHHQQAIEMADLAESRAESQEVKDLATDIEAAQGPEIETLTGWLESWGEDVPDEGMSGMDHGDMSSDDMGGMMTADEMAERLVEHYSDASLAAASAASAAGSSAASSLAASSLGLALAGAGVLGSEADSFTAAS